MTLTAHNHPWPARRSYMEYYRLDGSSSSAATPEIAAGIPGVSSATIAVGNTVTVTGPRLGLSVTWEPRTDPAARVEINDRGYEAAGGEVFPQWQTFTEFASAGRVIVGDVTVTAFADTLGGDPAVAYVEVAVERPLPLI